MKRILLGISMLSLSALTAEATTPKLEGTFNDWTVYSKGSGKARVCFAITEPEVKAPANVNHGDIYFMVSSWASGAAKEQPSLLTGYTLKTTRAPAAYVGPTKVLMYASEQEAFIESSADEKNLVRKMRAGADMRVEAVSQRGTETSYVFSLKGVTAALRKAKSVCG